MKELLVFGDGAMKRHFIGGCHELDLVLCSLYKMSVEFSELQNHVTYPCFNIPRCFVVQYSKSMSRNLNVV
jgi:hypothetical protein